MDLGDIAAHGGIALGMTDHAIILERGRIETPAYHATQGTDSVSRRPAPQDDAALERLDAGGRQAGMFNGTNSSRRPTMTRTELARHRRGQRPRPTRSTARRGSRGDAGDTGSRDDDAIGAGKGERTPPCRLPLRPLREPSSPAACTGPRRPLLHRSSATSAGRRWRPPWPRCMSRRASRAVRTRRLASAISAINTRLDVPPSPIARCAYLILDARYEKCALGSQAVMVAVGIDGTDGVRSSPSRWPTARAARPGRTSAGNGVELIVADDHQACARRHPRSQAFQATCTSCATRWTCRARPTTTCPQELRWLYDRRTVDRNSAATSPPIAK